MEKEVTSRWKCREGGSGPTKQGRGAETYCGGAGGWMCAYEVACSTCTHATGEKKRSSRTTEKDGVTTTITHKRQRDANMEGVRSIHTHTHTHSDKDVPKRPKTNKQTKEKKTQPIKRKQKRTMKTTMASIAEWGDETSRDLHACTCMRARMGERSLEEICKLFADRISPLRLKEKKTHTQGRRKVRWG